MNIGIISAKLNSVDGVSIEAAKWQKIFEAWGHRVFLCAGAIQTTPTPHYIIPELDYQDAEIHRLAHRMQADDHFSLGKYAALRRLAAHIHDGMHHFINANDIHLLDVENLLSLPLNLPAALALVDHTTTHPLPTIARHHDFY